MEFRQLGRSGLRISTLTLGTMTFVGGGGNSPLASTDLDGAKRQIGMALDAGVNLIDTADIYSAGVSEEIVGQAIKGKRDDLLLSSKVRMKTGRTTRACPGTTSSPAWRPACGGWTPTTSTSTTCTSGTGRRRSRRPCPRWTPWSRRARSVTWPRPTTRA